MMLQSTIIIGFKVNDLYVKKTRDIKKKYKQLIDDYKLAIYDSNIIGLKISEKTSNIKRPTFSEIDFKQTQIINPYDLRYEEDYFYEALENLGINDITLNIFCINRIT